MYVSMSTVLISFKITICSSNYLNFIMIDDKELEQQIKLIREKNPDIKEEFMKKIYDQDKINRGLARAGLNNSDTRGKADEFLARITDTNGMNSVGVQQKEQQNMAHDYDSDPYLRKTIMEIINTPGYDPDSVKEAQRQLLRMNQGLPRFPTV